MGNGQFAQHARSARFIDLAISGPDSKFTLDVLNEGAATVAFILYGLEAEAPFAIPGFRSSWKRSGDGAFELAIRDRQGEMFERISVRRISDCTYVSNVRLDRRPSNRSPASSEIVVTVDFSQIHSIYRSGNGSLLVSANPGAICYEYKLDTESPSGVGKAFCPPVQQQSFPAPNILIIPGTTPAMERHQESVAYFKKSVCSMRAS